MSGERTWVLTKAGPDAGAVVPHTAVALKNKSSRYVALDIRKRYVQDGQLKYTKTGAYLDETAARNIMDYSILVDDDLATLTNYLSQQVPHREERKRKFQERIRSLKLAKKFEPETYATPSTLNQ